MNRRAFRLWMALAALLIAGAAHADYLDEPEISTAPIGSSFYRHLAFDFGLDLKDLVRYEKRGFGRAEIITLILISKSTGTALNVFANRRLKDQVELKTLAAEVGLDYPTLYKTVRILKESIEGKGQANLPPPVYPDGVKDKSTPGKAVPAAIKDAAPEAPESKPVEP